MPSAIKLRDLAAAKTNGKSAVADAKASTPLWKQKLLSRTGVTPTATPVRTKPEHAVDSTLGELTSPAPASQAEDTNAVGSDQQSGTGPELKLTILQPPPLLPKPELTRPGPPTDCSAMLRKLRDLRAAGASMLGTADAASDSGAAFSALTAVAGPLGSHPAGAASPSPYSRQHQPPSPGLVTSSLVPSRGLLATPPHGASRTPQPHHPASITPGLFNPAKPHGWALHAHPATPNAASVGPAIASSPCGTPVPISTPSMLGLRQQELRETGGGFLTHYADPRDVATPYLQQPSAHGGQGEGAGATGRRTGPGTTGHGAARGAGAGPSTPLSVLRTIHKLQQLQRLQREGSQLVDAIVGES